MLKSTIPFANIRFFDDVPTVSRLEMRFTKFLRQLRDRRETERLIEAKVEGGSDETLDLFPSGLSSEDKMRIANRAVNYVDRLDAATGMQHLKTDDRKALRRLKDGVTVSRVPTEHDADVLAATLHEEMPWMGPATEHIWHALRKSVREDLPGFQFAPLLLLGPPGIGKSHWARRLGKLLKVPTTVVEATGEPASFALIGSQRGWGNAGPGKIMETILREKCASPIMVVDEVEKAGEVNSEKGLRFSLTDALLPLLERMTYPFSHPPMTAMPINHMKRCSLPDRVLIVADLHLDQWLASGRDPFAALDPDDLSQLDALIIVGDLSDKPKVRWPHALDHIAKYVDPRKTWIVPGNHDYYHHTLDGDERLASICYEKGVNFAQKRVIVVGETRYLCCTLWTNFALEGSAEFGMNDAAKRMNDYQYIRMAKSGYGRIRPLDTARVHSDHRAWLEAQLAEHYEGRTVVVTHHAPLPACLPDDYPVPSAYASDLSHIIERHSPQEWFYGHAHVSITAKQLSEACRLGIPSKFRRTGWLRIGYSA